MQKFHNEINIRNFEDEYFILTFIHHLLMTFSRILPSTLQVQIYLNITIRLALTSTFKVGDTFINRKHRKIVVAKNLQIMFATIIKFYFFIARNR